MGSAQGETLCSPPSVTASVSPGGWLFWHRPPRPQVSRCSRQPLSVLLGFGCSRGQAVVPRGRPAGRVTPWSACPPWRAAPLQWAAAAAVGTSWSCRGWQPGSQGLACAWPWRGGGAAGAFPPPAQPTAWAWATPSPRGLGRSSCWPGGPRTREPSSACFHESLEQQPEAVPWRRPRAPSAGCVWWPEAWRFGLVSPGPTVLTVVTAGGRCVIGRAGRLRGLESCPVRQKVAVPPLIQHTPRSWVRFPVGHVREAALSVSFPFPLSSSLSLPSSLESP